MHWDKIMDRNMYDNEIRRQWSRRFVNWPLNCNAPYRDDQQRCQEAADEVQQEALRRAKFSLHTDGARNLWKNAYSCL